MSDPRWQEYDRRDREAVIAHRRAMVLLDEATELHLAAIKSSPDVEFRELASIAFWASAKADLALCEARNARWARSYALHIAIGRVQP